jgi:hypothetical protein
LRGFLVGLGQRLVHAEMGCSSGRP